MKKKLHRLARACQRVNIAATTVATAISDEERARAARWAAAWNRFVKDWLEAQRCQAKRENAASRGAAPSAEPPPASVFADGEKPSVFSNSVERSADGLK